MIMTFKQYNNYLEDIEERIKVIGRRIAYREIQLIGRQYVSFSPLGCFNPNNSSNYTEEEMQLITRDKVLMALRKESERLANEKLHVTTFAEMPLDYDEAVSKVEECTKSELELVELAAFFDMIAEKEKQNTEIAECCTYKKYDELVDEDGNEKES